MFCLINLYLGLIHNLEGVKNVGMVLVWLTILITPFFFTKAYRQLIIKEGFRPINKLQS